MAADFNAQNLIWLQCHLGRSESASPSSFIPVLEPPEGSGQKALELRSSSAVFLHMDVEGRRR
jgi:hypothetical protein